MFTVKEFAEIPGQLMVYTVCPVMVSFAEPEDEILDLHATPFLVILQPLMSFTVQEMTDVPPLETRAGVAEMLALGA